VKRLDGSERRATYTSEEGGNMVRVCLESTLGERFWVKVEKTPTCWLWTASVHTSGYGQIGHGPKKILAHRASWLLSHGEIPDKLHVLHHCDTKLCVRPKHLFLGTNSDNVADMVAKGRQAKGRIQCGSLNPNSKLTEAQVVEIRRRVAGGETRKALAGRFKVSLSLVNQIVQGGIWKHLPVSHGL
jgi:hypothetical protein